MLETCLQQLTTYKLRRTKNREILLTVLHRARGPLSPPEIVSACHALGRQVNKTTIYRELDLLERVGLIKRVRVSDRKQYFELSERGHHHHFVCLNCDEVQDITIQDASLIAQARMLGKQLRFSVEAHAVEFYGSCHNCLGLT